MSHPTRSGIRHMQKRSKHIPVSASGWFVARSAWHFPTSHSRSPASDRGSTHNRKRYGRCTLEERERERDRMTKASAAVKPRYLALLVDGLVHIADRGREIHGTRCGLLHHVLDFFWTNLLQIRKQMQTLFRNLILHSKLRVSIPRSESIGDLEHCYCTNQIQSEGTRELQLGPAMHVERFHICSKRIQTTLVKRFTCAQISVWIALLPVMCTGPYRIERGI